MWEGKANHIAQLGIVKTPDTEYLLSQCYTNLCWKFEGEETGVDHGWQEPVIPQRWKSLDNA